MFKTRNIKLFNVRRVDSENMGFGVRGTLSKYNNMIPHAI